MKLYTNCSYYNEEWNSAHSPYPGECESCRRFNICKECYIKEKSETIAAIFINTYIDVICSDDAFFRFIGVLILVYSYLRLESENISNDISINILDKTKDIIDQPDYKYMEDQYRNKIVTHINIMKDKLLPRNIEVMSPEEYYKAYNSSRFNNGAILIFTHDDSEESAELMKDLNEKIKYRYKDKEVLNVVFPKKDWKLYIPAPVVMILGKDKSIDSIHSAGHYSVSDLVFFIKINKRMIG